MLKKDVVKHFGGDYGCRVKIADFAEVSKGAVTNWGPVVPAVTALKIHLKSHGSIPFRPKDYVDDKFWRHVLSKMK